MCEQNYTDSCYEVWMCLLGVLSKSHQKDNFNYFGRVGEGDGVASLASSGLLGWAAASEKQTSRIAANVKDGFEQLQSINLEIYLF